MPKRKNTDNSQGAGSSKKPLLNDDKDQNVGKNSATEDSCSGKILYIHLKNFMCHSNLRVELNKRCNVIVGNNGSGKSAILTSLIIGLGGKASTAHRSSNIKQLVKHGQSSCTIEICLANNGIDSFDRKRFGDRIVVSRKIASSGASTYKICNAKGEEISKDRHLLEKLLMYFNIQIDNPVCILHQDAARSFLKDCDPKKLFVFYMKATQLQDMLDKLNQCLALYRSNRTQYEMLMSKIQVDSKEVNEVRHKHKALSSVNNTKQLIAQLRKELLWIKYNDQRDLFAKTEAEYKGVLEMVQRLQEFLDSRASSVENMNRRIQMFQEQKRQKNEQVMKLIHEYNAFQSECDEQKDLEVGQKTTYEIQKKKRQRIEENIARVKEHLASDNFEEKVEKMKRENEQKMEKYSDDRNEILAVSSSLDRDLEDLEKILMQTDKSYDSCGQRKNYLESELGKVSRECRQIDLNAKDELAIYGSHMGVLLKEIETRYRKGEFSMMPLGPFGRYIKVQDTKWREIVEHIVGRYVTAFLCNSHRDHQLLVSIMKRIIPGGRLPSITVTPFEASVYNFASGRCEAPRGTVSLVDVIQVSDHNIMNTLINALHIESILLTEHMELAMRLTDGSNIPRNLRKIILAKPFQEYAVRPFRMYSMKLHPGRYIQANLRDVKETLQRQEKHLQEEYQKVLQKFKKLTMEKREQEARMAEKTEEKRNLENKLKHIEQKIREIQNIVYPSTIENDALKEEYETLKKNHEKALSLEKREKEKYAVIKKKLEELMEKREKMKAEEVELSKEIRKLNSDEDVENSKIASVEYNCKESETKLAQKQEIAEYLAKELEKLKNLMDSALVRAEKSGVRIETTRSEETVSALIKEGQASITQLEGLYGSLDALTDHLHLITDRLEKDKRVAGILDETLTMLKVTHYKRHQAVIRLKRHISSLMQHHFSKLLQLRGFKGDINVDYELKMLELKVIPRDNHISSATSNTQALSGGERSFTTVSFLLSLWACVNHPFFLLDEYDVFTDPVNRQYMTQLLIRETEKNPCVQYTFLTPQDMSSLEASSKLTIHKMADPQ
ncbi:structural maintenance of chromosomes protein 6 isoform X2 [Phlebotomus papatasi]|uniref:structural maintenance of chromosomes protein 6 isoform X2 n=1 Tax=Phlebotomus papatasi TaxID=29031 RepID=UPI0024842BAF|nr:structural maintenance of chromosomes protein 6 isoform X2 [Phlebotomus papatasi]XP_055715888.1 structural maintenance of chromosomes protein 6 isoform X2 [Phlebotomus papatasi]